MKKLNFNNVTFGLLILFGVIGVAVSFILSVEIVDVLKNKDYIPTCSINKVFDCLSVMKSKEATVFGFPNPFLGLAAYSAVVFTGASFFFGARMNKWYFLLFNIGAGLAFIFSYWLLFSSVFNIGTLCPYCIASCFAATNIFFATVLYNSKEGYFGQVVKKFLIDKKYSIPIIVAWYVAVIAIVTLHFVS